jgi:predicted dehydrogenase
MFEAADVYGIGYDAERAQRQTIRLGAIGLGGVAQSKYLPAISRLQTLWEPVELAAFAEPRKDQAEKVAQIYGAKAYDSHTSLLESEALDGVLVLSSDDGHFEHALACVEAGVPVLVEKPFTRSLSDAHVLCRAAAVNNLPLMAVANKRYSPPYAYARRLMGEGPLADPAMFAAKFTLGYDYVDLLEDGTIHLLDLARFFMGEVTTLSARAVNRYGFHRNGYPFDNAVITMTFASGAVGTVYTSSGALSLKPWERVEVYGRHAWLSVEDQYELTLHDSETAPAKTWRAAPPNTLMFDEEWGGYLGQIENFAQTIRGAADPVVTGWDGLRAIELVMATHLSAAGAGEVTLPLDTESADNEVAKLVQAARVGR